jgi:tRNA threonylcarbamoyl adenosine modification protein (Sua5/YciO/YrdC/YwlC family)
MLIRVHPENPPLKKIRHIVEIIKDGGVIIYPTDTVYGLGCDIFNSKAVERVSRIKGIKVEKANFSIICHDLSNISDYTRQFSNHTFKMMKKHLPGPFTFILPANNNVPKIFRSKKKTIGIRIPKNNIPLEIVRELGHPILTTSIHDTDKVLDYTTDPELIYENYGKFVDAVVDGGYCHNTPSTILDCTNEHIEMVRQGLGEFENF